MVWLHCHYTFDDITSKKIQSLKLALYFLYNENHAIVAWFKKRLTDEKIKNRGKR